MRFFMTIVWALGAALTAVPPLTAQIAGDGLHAPGKRAGPPPVATVSDHRRVSFDLPGDGSLWARGQNYKVGFHDGTVAYYPFFGSQVPQSYPLVLRLASLSRGGRALDLASAPPPLRNGHRVSLDRGPVVECYDVAPAAMEQVFRFDRLEGAGELVMRIEALTDLAGDGCGTDLRFDCAFGSVTYTRAVAIDAAGARISVETNLTPWGIEIRVPAGFVDRARLPLTIDPVISAVPVSTSVAETTHPDTTFDASTGYFMAVWEEVFSATDHDVYSQAIDFNGTPVTGTGTWIDSTAAYWAQPKTASIQSVPRCLTVAQVGLPGGGAHVIMGRMRNGSLSFIGPQFAISGAEPGEKINPDVGGDPVLAAPSYFCVVWERVFTPGDHDIHGRLVTAASGLVGAFNIPVSDTGDDDRSPAISKSNGGLPISTQRWTVVWQRNAGPDYDIYGSQLAWDGTVTAPAFPMETSLANTTLPAVSTVTDASGGHRYYLVVFETLTATGSHDVGYLILENAFVVDGNLSLSLVEGVALDDRQYPVADSDGCTFTIAYGERFNGNPLDYDIYATTLNVAGGSATGVSEARAVVAATTDLENHASIASAWGGGGPGLRLFILWDRQAITNDIHGVMYDAHATSGGFSVVPTGCQGLTLLTGGIPAIGEVVSFTLTNAVGTSLLALALPSSPVTFCGWCQIGIDMTTALFVPGPAIQVYITCEGLLVGLQVAVQGADLGGFSCNGLRVSDTVVVTIM